MNIEEKTRSRTITWEDPTEGVREGKKLSGLAYLQAIQHGELPTAPFASLLGMDVLEVNEGRVVFGLQPAEYHYNPIGSVHGGVAAMLLDSAIGCAIHSLLQVGQWYTTLELKVNYLRALTEDTGHIVCEGKIIHLGGRVATAEGRITDASGKLYAHGTATCLILRP